MVGDYPDRLREWQAAAEFDKITKKRWLDDLRAAQENKKPLPSMPAPMASDIAPAKAAPASARHDDRASRRNPRHGIAERRSDGARRDRRLVNGDGRLTIPPAALSGSKLTAGALTGSSGANTARSRSRSSAWPSSVYGGTQPERLSEMSAGPDDGLFSRILWLWPDPVPFRLGGATPGVGVGDRSPRSAARAGPCSRQPPSPVLMPLTPAAQRLMEEFGKEMEARLKQSGGLLRSAYGKARGAALSAVAGARMAVVLRRGRHAHAAGQHLQRGLHRRRDAGRRVLHADGGARIRRRWRD